MQSATSVPTPSLKRSLTRVTLGGALAMVYITGTTCPAVTQYFRSLGATAVHFGILGGLPLIMVLMQFFGAAAANRLRSRKLAFMVLFITARLLYLPVAFAALAFGGATSTVSVTALLLLIALSHALSNTGTPLWFSWMADLIPRRVLNSYWGTRQRWMSATWILSYLAIAAFSRFADLPIHVAFPILATVAVTAGVVDILLFRRVHEPPNAIVRGRSPLDILLEPLRHREYRTFVGYSCAWNASSMFAAAFMQLYVLDVMGIPWGVATLIWCAARLGTMLSATWWGRLADRHGHRPILAIALFFKPAIIVVFLFLTPGSAIYVLPVAFLLDSVWNAALMVASNGYMMKIAPRENRSMFVAAITGLAGLCGGLAAILGGFFLDATSSFTFHVGSLLWTNFHLVFLLSLVMRIACAVLVHRVREPTSSRTFHVLNDVWGPWPLRLVRYPVGLNRSNSPDNDAGADG